MLILFRFKTVWGDNWHDLSVCKWLLTVSQAGFIGQNLEVQAYAETVHNSKAIRETLKTDIPLSAEYLRDFAGYLRLQDAAWLQVAVHNLIKSRRLQKSCIFEICVGHCPALRKAPQLRGAITMHTDCFQHPHGQLA